MSKIKKIIKRFINKFFHIFKINDKKIVFQGNPNMLDGNPKAIYDYMKKNNPDYRLVCIVNKSVDVSNLPKSDYAFYRTFKEYFHLATAKYWIRSQSIGGLIEKRKGQVYIQTWHGHGALKKMSYDLENLKDLDKTVELEHVRDWDYYISTDKLDGEVIVSSTKYSGKIVELGAPSLDILVNECNNEKLKESIKNKIGISKDNNKKIVLYAPTFRDLNLKSDLVSVPIQMLKKLKDYVVLVRLHPLIENKIDKSLFSDNFINVCSYPDVTDLLLISDLLISDYSNVIYEYSLLNRPIILYAYDLESYEKERGFYIDYNSLPGIIVKDEKSLYETLRQEKYLDEKYKTKLNKFNDKYNKNNDGTVTKRIVDLIVSGYFNESRNAK